MESRTATQDATVTYEIDADERPSEAVVRAVASLANTSVLELDPLYHTIDPQHLDELFDGADDDRPTGRSFTFSFEGYDVTVDGDVVHVREPDD